MAVEDGAWIMKGVDWEDRTSSVNPEGTARHGCRAPKSYSVPGFDHVAAGVCVGV